MANNEVKTSLKTISNLLFSLSGNTTGQAQTATLHALNLWSEQLFGNVPVDINIELIPMGANVLGASYRTPSHLIDGTYYPSPLANQLLGYNFSSQRDILIEMNSNYPWYFGLDGNTTGYDWVTIMLHEVTHGLGFFPLVGSNGAYIYTTSSGSSSSTSYPGIYDRQLYQGATGNTCLTDLNQSQRAALVISSNLFAGKPGSHLLAANGGTRVKMYAPNPWRPGSSVSHWDWSVTYFPNFMRHAYASPLHTFNTRKIGIMRDMGWETCDITISGPISGPQQLCSTVATYTLNNLPAVDSIIWEHGTFLTIESGQNTNSSLIKATGNGSSWVQARLVTHCGSITLPRKTVWAGSRWPTILLCPVNNDYPGSVGPSVACGNTGQVYWLYAHGANLSANDADYRWKFYSSNPFELPVQAIGRQVEFGSATPGSFTVSLQYNGECGWSNEVFSNICIEPSRESEFYLSLSPNPASHETTLTIESTSPEKTFDDTVPWDVEVYSGTQTLITKQSGLRGQSTQIHTAGLKEGIYIVRVNYNPDGKPGGILTAKLVVKR